MDEPGRAETQLHELYLGTLYLTQLLTRRCRRPLRRVRARQCSPQGLLMVNFGNQIRNHAVGRWVSHYVQYRELKVSILKTVEQLSADGTPGSPAVEPGRRVGSSTVSTPLLTYPASNALIDKLMDGKRVGAGA